MHSYICICHYVRIYPHYTPTITQLKSLLYTERTRSPCPVRWAVCRQGVLQCIAVCCCLCYLLQCVAVCCSVLQCFAVCCSVLQYTRSSSSCQRPREGFPWSWPQEFSWICFFSFVEQGQFHNKDSKEIALKGTLVSWKEGALAVKLFLSKGEKKKIQTNSAKGRRRGWSLMCRNLILRLRDHPRREFFGFFFFFPWTRTI